MPANKFDQTKLRLVYKTGINPDTKKAEYREALPEERAEFFDYLNTMSQDYGASTYQWLDFFMTESGSSQAIADGHTLILNNSNESGSSRGLIQFQDDTLDTLHKAGYTPVRYTQDDLNSLAPKQQLELINSFYSYWADLGNFDKKKLNTSAILNTVALAPAILTKKDFDPHKDYILYPAGSSNAMAQASYVRDATGAATYQSFANKYKEDITAGRKLVADNLDRPTVLGYDEWPDGKKIAKIKMPAGDVVDFPLSGGQVVPIGNNLYWKDSSGDNMWRIPKEKDEKFDNGYFPVLNGEWNQWQGSPNRYNNTLGAGQTIYDLYDKEFKTFQDKIISGTMTPTDFARANRTLMSAKDFYGGSDDNAKFEQIAINYYDKVTEPYMETTIKEQRLNIQNAINDKRLYLDRVVDPQEAARVEADIKKLEEQRNAWEAKIQNLSGLREEAKNDIWERQPGQEYVERKLTVGETVVPTGGRTGGTLKNSTGQGLEDLNTMFADRKNSFLEFESLLKDWESYGFKPQKPENHSNGTNPGNASGGVFSGYEEITAGVTEGNKDNIDNLDDEIDVDYLKSSIAASQEALTALSGMQSPKAVEEEQKKGVDWGNVFGNAFDLYRIYEGFKGAKKQVPEYKKGDMFQEYIDDARSMKDMGLTPLEISQRKQMAERAYGYDVSNIKGLAGGSAGVALGNLGRAARGLQDRYAQVGVEDHMVRRANRQNFAQAAVADEQINSKIFDAKLKQVLMDKQTGAALAIAGMENMRERQQFNESNKTFAEYYGMLKKERDFNIQARESGMEQRLIEQQRVLKDDIAKKESTIKAYEERQRNKQPNGQ